MKGILLAGGANTRLYPLTNVLSKQLLPVYDKPMVYYPLSVLMLAGIREILIISTPRDIPRFEDLLGDGSKLGLRFSYMVQEKPEGIAHALVLGRDFLAGDSCALILGDNILYGHNIYEILASAAERESGATVFAYEVRDPERFGVVEIGPDNVVVSIEEKPAEPKSHWAAIGLYFYDSRACNVAAQLKPSARGELEITDVNKWYLEQDQLFVEKLYRGFAWLDCGNFEALQEASEFVHTMQKRQRYRIACVEEIAYRLGYIDSRQLQNLADTLSSSEYGQYLMQLAQEEPVMRVQIHRN